MNRTVTALYKTRAEADRVRDALVAANLGGHVTIRDQGDEDDSRLRVAFDGHDDSRLYAEGLRRGHVLLTARVDDLKEIRAAEILDAEAPVNLEDANRSWRGDGWTPTTRDGRIALAEETAREAGPMGACVRIYTLSQ
jgi:hypothetical protein